MDYRHPSFLDCLGITKNTLVVTPLTSPYYFSDDYSLYVSDLDGTLLNAKSHLSSNTRKILTDVLINQRKAFTIASARSLYTIREIIQDLPLILPVIQLNGALITDYHSHEDFHQIFLDEKEILNLLGIFNDLKTCVLSSVKELHSNKNLCLIPSKRNQAMEEFYRNRIQKRDSRIIVISDIKYIQNYRPISFTVIEPYSRSLEIFKIINSELEGRVGIYPMGMDNRGWEWTTLQNRHANKGDAVEKICEIFNFTPEKVTVFGDNVNDLSMFNKQFKGVAVENAHPQIKSKACDIIGNHHYDSVAQYVQAK